MAREKVVVIEDEADILEIMEYNLVREGYRVLTSKNGEEGLARVRKELPELVLLDLMLPGIDGIEVCRSLKRDPETRNIPIIMVTAKGEESDVVLGLGVGADDYITKPFSPKELLARIRAVLRRGPLKEDRSGGRIVLQDLVIDPSRHEFLVKGKQVSLTATEMRLLYYLASHPGRVFTRDHLLSRAIGEESEVIDRNVDVHIRAIRRKAEACGDLIETVRGVGYRFREAEGR